MTAATVTAAPAHPAGGPRTLAGTAGLLRLALRRDRLRLVVWVLGVGLLAGYSVAALETAYPTAADRQARAALMANPAAVMLSGPAFGLQDYTLGAMVANEIGLTVMIAVGIMSILLVVRHTRAEEASGRAELVRAAVVGRRAPLAAALAVVAFANVLVAAVTAGGLVATGLPARDTVAFAVATGVTGLVFAAVAAVTAQLTEHPRAASGAALGVLGAAVVVRGVGDVLEPGGSALSWFSPIAWAQQTRVFVDLRWWPLLASAAAVAVALLLADRLAARRDVGAGLLPARRGPADASPLLAGPAALAARLQRGTLAGWAVGLLLTGLTFGSLTEAVVAAVGDNPQLAAFLAAGAEESLVDAFLAAMTVYVALGAAAFATTAVLRQRAEESAGRAEALLARPLGRTRLMGAGLLVTAGGAVILLLAGGLGMGVAAAAVSGEGRLVGELVLAALVHLPAVLVVAGAAVALVGLAPRAAGLAWVVLGYAVLAGMFGALLGLPEWALRLSPFAWVPALPGAPLDTAPLAGLAVLAAALTVAGLAGFRRRDVG